jgi:dihydroorotase
LIAGVADGTITVIATDHAPHSATAKQVEFDHAPFGIVGLETAFPVCFTELVERGIISIPQLIAKLTVGPAEVLRMENYSLAIGNPADITVFDPEAEYVIDKEKFYSKSRNTPFDGMTVKGKIDLTVVDGKIAYRGGC